VVRNRLALELPRVDLFLSAAAEEVLPLYDWPLPKLRKQFRVFRDNSASGVPVGMLYHGMYHTVVIAPATSNTVAKCAFGISDTLPTNMYAQAGKQCIPGIVFACDTEPTVVTQSPNEWVELRPRAIELDNVERLSRFEYTTLVRSLDELKAALGERLSIVMT
jgi:flavoprotein